MTRGTCGKNLTWTLDENGTLLISGTGNMENFTTEPPWADSCYFIKKVVVYYGVTSIGDNAFYRCENLKSAIIPGSVILIGERAFRRCRNLTKIKIPDSVKKIKDEAFSVCYKLEWIKIPASVDKIGENVFSDCHYLKEINYPEGRGFEEVLSQGNNAKLLPYTVKMTSQSMSSSTSSFGAGYGLEAVKVAHAAEKLRWKFDGKTLTVGGVRVIKDFSREEPPWLDKILDIQKIIVEEGVEKISANAFIDCKRLELLTIPASVKTIGDMAFTACFCGNRFENGGRNVFWCVEDGVLVFKKNPAAKVDADFSTGSVSWLPVEKNITGFKLEPGIVPKEKFFEWMTKRGDALQASFE